MIVDCVIIYNNFVINMIYCCNDIFLALNLCHNGHASVRGVICAVGDDDFAEGCDLGALPTEEVGRNLNLNCCEYLVSTIKSLFFDACGNHFTYERCCDIYNIPNFVKFISGQPENYMIIYKVPIT